MPKVIGVLRVTAETYNEEKRGGVSREGGGGGRSDFPTVVGIVVHARRVATRRLAEKE